MNTARLVYHRLFKVRAHVSSQWFRGLIIAVAISLCIALVLLNSWRGFITFAIIEFGILAAVLLFNHPPVGIAILIITSLIIPFELGTGTQTNLNATVLLLPILLGLFLLDLITSPRKSRVISLRVIFALIAFTTVILLSYLNGLLLAFRGTNASISAQLGQLAIFLLSLGAFLLMQFQVRSIKWLKRLVWLFLLLGGIYVVSYIVPVLEYFVVPLFSRGSVASLFWVWFVVLSFTQAVFNVELSKSRRVVLGVLCILTVYISISEGLYWASGWLPSLIAIYAALFARSLKLGLCTSIVVLPVIFHQFDNLQQIILINESYSAVTRQAAWINLLELIKQSPLLGFGPANYYWYTASKPIMGWYVYYSSHNNYIDIITQTGFLGLVSFIWLMWEIIRSGINLRLIVPQGFTRAYVYGALGGLVGTLAAGLLGDWFLPFVYNIGISGMRSSILTWLFLGGLVGIPHMLRGSEDRTAS